MNDRRWPWLIAVPMRPGLSELHELAPDDLARCSAEIARLSAALKTVTGCEKINCGALGNIVRQLHIHVIARETGDPNWPGPVWGHGTALPYAATDANETIAACRSEIEKTGGFRAD